MLALDDDLLQLDDIGAGRRHHAVVDRHVEEGAAQHAGHHDLLAFDLVGERTEDREQRHTEQDSDGDHDPGCFGVELQDRRDVVEGVELAGVPDDALTGGGAEQRGQDPLPVFPALQGVAERGLGRLARVLQALEDGRFLHPQPDEQRHADQQDGDQERDPVTPVGEAVLGHGAVADDHDHDGEEQAGRGRDLDEARVEAPLVVGDVLRHVDRGPAVLAAERQALQQAQRHQQDRRQDADRRIGRQEADEGGRQAHHRDRHEERELPANDVPDASEYGGPERAHGEAGSEGGQRREKCRDVVTLREELR